MHRIDQRDRGRNGGGGGGGGDEINADVCVRERERERESTGVLFLFRKREGEREREGERTGKGVGRGGEKGAEEQIFNLLAGLDTTPLRFLSCAQRTVVWVRDSSVGCHWRIWLAESQIATCNSYFEKIREIWGHDLAVVVATEGARCVWWLHNRLLVSLFS